jgi:hypothetical protein
MLPNVDALFTLVRDLAHRASVTQISAPKWLVQRHGLAPLAARAGDSSYRDQLVRATIEWARVDKDIPPVVAALVDAGIRVAPIKGTAYAKALYAAPAERPMADVDLLVTPGAERRAAAVLRRLGYEPGVSAVLHHAETWVRGDTVIDLHWNIIAPGRGRIDLDAVWARTVAGWPRGAEQLELTDMLVFHLVHLARNRLLLPLVNVVDAARMLERGADPELAIERARAWGLGFAAMIGVRFCTEILGGTEQQPAGWLGPSHEDIVLLRESSAVRSVLFEIALAGGPLQLAARAFGLGANKLHELVRRR